MHIDFGSVLYSDKLFISLASNSLIQKILTTDEGLNVIKTPSYNFVIGTISNTGPYLEVYPIGGLSIVHNEVEWSLGARLRYRKIVSFGARYFDKTKITGLLGLHLDAFSFQYAYDTYAEGLNILDANVHEIIIGVSLFNRFDNKTRFW